MIRISELNKYYNKGKQNEIHVINDISLELPETGIVALFGQSGCGKTTLLNTIGGLDTAASGSVCFDEEQMDPEKDALRNRNIGYIFQNYYLLNDRSVYENVSDSLRLCGLKDEKDIEERVKLALENVGMTRYLKRTPDTLSAGQQQRVAIARAIVKNPKVLLADEPTGNLDEENTVAIMNLLREISKTRLVILVTHEAELVDYYCDTVIGLSDGRVVSRRENNTENGYFAKSRNTIYLGEFEHTAENGKAVNADYYGELPEEPLHVTVVRKDGKWYVRIDNDQVKLVDDASEISFKEGTFREETERRKNEQSFRPLPEVTGDHFGRLFTFRNSFFKGLRYFRKKKSDRLLRSFLFITAFALVFITAFKATFLSKVDEVRESYSENVFFVPAMYGDAVTNEVLRNAVSDPASGISFVTLFSDSMYTELASLKEVAVDTDVFESYSVELGYSFLGGDTGSVQYDATVLPDRLAENNSLVCGKASVSENEAIVTTGYLKGLLKNSNVSWLSEYEDFLGLSLSYVSNYSYGTVNAVISGVVESTESFVYVKEEVLADIALSRTGLLVRRASDYDMSTADGTAIAFADSEEHAYSEDTVLINGISFTAKSVFRTNEEQENYFYGGLSEKEYTACLLEYLEENGYSDEAAYIGLNAADLASLESVKEAFLQYVREEYGFFDPENDESEENQQQYLDSNWQMVIDELENWYLPYYKGIDESADKFSDEGLIFLVSDSDYIRISESCGECSGEVIKYSNSEEEFIRMLVYSEDPDKTDRYLSEKLSGNAERILSANGWEDDSYMISEVGLTHDYISYDSYCSDELKELKSSLRSGLITIAVILLLISLIIFLAMRSNLMEAVHEIGIYRAIGVSRKNLWFRYFAEGLALELPTIYLGFLLSSGFLLWLRAKFSLVSSTVYYNPFVMLVLLLVVFLVTTLGSVLPVMLLTRKTPAEILAKYDI